MKLIFFLTILSSQVFAQALETKVCTVFHDDKATNCLGKEKKDYPTGVLYGVSKVKTGTAQQLKHFWNGKPVELLTSFSNKRILVSAFNVPADYKGELTFGVHSADDQLINQNTYIVTRGPLALTAEEKLAVVDTAPVVTQAPAAPAPRQKMEMDEMYIPAPHAAPAANSTAQKALDAAPVSNANKVEPKSTKSAPPVERSETILPPVQEDTASNHQWLRFELHGAYVSQKDSGEAGTAIGYWAPEMRFTSVLGMGARIGGTQWKEKGEDRFTAFESDLHLSFTLDSQAGHLTFQPLVGYHSWGDLGSQISYGGNLVMQQARSPLSFILGGQAWKHEGVSYTFINVGIGVSL